MSLMIDELSGTHSHSALFMGNIFMPDNRIALSEFHATDVTRMVLFSGMAIHMDIPCHLGSITLATHFALK